MSDQSSLSYEPSFCDQLDEVSKAWCERIIDAFDAGGYEEYEEMAEAVAADGAEVEGSIAC